MKWFAGSDHAGYTLKVHLIGKLRERGDEVVDLGSDNATDSVDYPDFGQAVARKVVENPGSLGLLVCGSGLGVSMAANKVPGARAARVCEAYSAKMARAHNDANVLCLGERVIGPGVAEECVWAFRDTPFEGGRHERRVQKIRDLDK